MESLVVDGVFGGKIWSVDFLVNIDGFKAIDSS